MHFKQVRMSRIHYLPDEKAIEVRPDETLLSASLHSGIQHTHVCGGQGRCSTCRVAVVDGLERCNPPNSVEAAMATRLGFDSDIRLACQTTVSGDVVVRRLLLDDLDLSLVVPTAMCPTATSAGQERRLAVLFSDIRGFTSFSEALPPYDVIHVLRRYFGTMKQIVNASSGVVNNTMGDGLMALFGLTRPESASIDAVEAGLKMLDAMTAMQPYLQTAYGRKLEIGVGIHVGEVVIGTIASDSGQEVTAIGDTVNFASRIESANKQAGTRLLISHGLLAEVSRQIQVGRCVRVPISGKSGEYELHEVTGLNPPATANRE